MRWEQKVATHLMSMDEATWERHANPWSVWTRIGSAPVFFLALWSHVWIGWWALAPIALVALWAWLNPRIFAKPASTRSWGSRAVLGERVWIARDAVAIPRHHAQAAQLLSALSGLFLAAALYGFVVQDFWAAFLGFFAAVAAKIWFCDRMVWLFEDMRAVHPPYDAWLYGPAPPAAAPTPV